VHRFLSTALAVIHLVGQAASTSAPEPPPGKSALCAHWQVCKRAVNELIGNLRFGKPDAFLHADEAQIIQEHIPNVGASVINIASRLQNRPVRVRCARDDPCFLLQSLMDAVCSSCRITFSGSSTSGYIESRAARNAQRARGVEERCRATKVLQISWTMLTYRSRWAR
jgi:hypothetical protein